MDSLADALQAKYGGKTQSHDTEPTEEEFQAAAKRVQSGSKQSKKSSSKEGVKGGIKKKAKKAKT